MEFNDSTERIRREVSLSERRIGEKTLNILAGIGSSITLNEAINMIEASDVEALDREIESSSSEIASDIFLSSFIVFLISTSKFISRKTKKTNSADLSTQGVLSFSLSNGRRISEEFRRQQFEILNLVRQTSEEEGLSSVQSAKKLRNSLGLTPRQYRSLEKTRKEIESLSSSYLRRSLRDRRLDGEFRSAMKSGRSLSARRADMIVKNYRQKLISYRARVIAQTEARRAVHAASEEAYRQALLRGVISSYSSTWNTSLKDNVRNSHSSMHGQTVSGGDPFISGLGNLLFYPRDINAPAEDTSNCVCTLSKKAKF